jgi:hypothetical protein
MILLQSGCFCTEYHTVKRTGGWEVAERNKLTREEGRKEIRKEITRREA